MVRKLDLPSKSDDCLDQKDEGISLMKYIYGICADYSFNETPIDEMSLGFLKMFHKFVVAPHCFRVFGSNCSFVLTQIHCTILKDDDNDICKRVVKHRTF